MKQSGNKYVYVAIYWALFWFRSHLSTLGLGLVSRSGHLGINHCDLIADATIVCVIFIRLLVARLLPMLHGAYGGGAYSG